MLAIPTAAAVTLALLSQHGSVHGRDPMIDSLAVRVEGGDTSARRQLAPIAERLVRGASERQLDPAAAATFARVALAMASPLSNPEGERTSRESIWRGPAVRALRSALATDRCDVWSASQLERITPYPYIWLASVAELATLRALATCNLNLPLELRVTRIRLEIEVGSLDSAAAYFSDLRDSQLSAAGRDRLKAEIEFARNNTAEAALAYYTGAEAIADSADASWYTRDLKWLARPEELREWDSLALRSRIRRTWLEAFWSRRDLVDGRLPGTRLVEHFRRWRVALRNYRWDNDGGVAVGIPDVGFAKEVSANDLGDATLETGVMPLGPINEVNRWRALSRVVDDRGALVIRHGDPIVLPQPPGITASTEQNLAWATPAGRLVVGFSHIELGSSRFGFVARNRPLGDPGTACLYDARYCSLQRLPKSLASDPSRAPPALLRMLIEDYAHQREAAEGSDGNAEMFRAPLGAIMQVYGVPDDGALVLLAIPLKGLVQGIPPRRITARIRVVVGDSAAGRIVATLDTLRTWEPPGPMAVDAWLGAYFLVPVVSGDWVVAVTVGDTAHGAGTGERFDGVPVPHFDGTTLRLSDPILGRTASGFAWRHNGEAVPLNPTNTWRPHELAVLTYEVDGLVKGRAYESSIELWPTGGHAKAHATVIQFTEPASGIHQSVQRELSLLRLPPGGYRLVVRIRDTITNARVARERRFAIGK